MTKNPKNTSKILENTKKSFNKLIELRKEIEEKKIREKVITDDHEWTKESFNQLELLDPKLGEEEKLNQTKLFLNNREKIFIATNQAKTIIDGELGTDAGIDIADAPKASLEGNTELLENADPGLAEGELLANELAQNGLPPDGVPNDQQMMADQAAAEAFSKILASGGDLDAAFDAAAVVAGEATTRF